MSFPNLPVSTTIKWGRKTAQDQSTHVSLKDKINGQILVCVLWVTWNPSCHYHLYLLYI